MMHLISINRAIGWANCHNDQQHPNITTIIGHHLTQTLLQTNTPCTCPITQTKQPTLGWNLITKPTYTINIHNPPENWQNPNNEHKITLTETDQHEITIHLITYHLPPKYHHWTPRNPQLHSPEDGWCMIGDIHHHPDLNQPNSIEQLTQQIIDTITTNQEVRPLAHIRRKQQWTS